MNENDSDFTQVRCFITHCLLFLLIIVFVIVKPLIRNPQRFLKRYPLNRLIISRGTCVSVLNV